jgi:hypothetical protein
MTNRRPVEVHRPGRQYEISHQRRLEARGRGLSLTVRQINRTSTGDERRGAAGFVKHGRFLECTSNSSTRGVALVRN